MVACRLPGFASTNSFGQRWKIASFHCFAAFPKKMALLWEHGMTMYEALVYNKNHGRESLSLYWLGSGDVSYGWKLNGIRFLWTIFEGNEENACKCMDKPWRTAKQAKRRRMRLQSKEFLDKSEGKRVICDIFIHLLSVLLGRIDASYGTEGENCLVCYIGSN